LLFPIAPAPQIFFHIGTAEFCRTNLSQCGYQMRINTQLHVVQGTVVPRRIIVNAQLGQFAHNHALGSHEVARFNFAKPKPQKAHSVGFRV
jgi:hypothetical protein